jgi:hypothetical protein
MPIRLADPPPHPFPQPPQPQHAEQRQVQPPMVYVYENPTWDYKVVVRDAAEHSLLSEQELNDLGSTGWELVGVVALTSKVQYCFKRARA